MLVLWRAIKLGFGAREGVLRCVEELLIVALLWLLLLILVVEIEAVVVVLVLLNVRENVGLLDRGQQLATGSGLVHGRRLLVVVVMLVLRLLGR